MTTHTTTDSTQCMAITPINVTQAPDRLCASVVQARLDSVVGACLAGKASYGHIKPLRAIRRVGWGVRVRVDDYNTLPCQLCPSEQNRTSFIQSYIVNSLFCRSL